MGGFWEAARLHKTATLNRIGPRKLGRYAAQSQDQEVNMTEIQGSKDCGNSPKNKFVQDVAISLETGEIDSECLSEDAVWHGVKNKPIEGIKAIGDQLADKAKPAAIVIEHAISHGKVGAASGEATLANGHTRRFSHIFEFTNTKANCVAAIKSYD